MLKSTIFALNLTRNSLQFLPTRACSSVHKILQKFNSEQRKISINLKNYKNIKIFPYDYVENPDGNLLSIQFLNSNNEAITSETIKDLNLQLSENSAVLSDLSSKDVSVILRIPVDCHEINIQSETADISVEDIQSSSVFINAGKDGNFRLKNLKSENIIGISENGSIRSEKLVLGENVYLSSGGDGVSKIKCL